MAYVHIIDSGSPINCPYGRVNSSNSTLKWTPYSLTCGPQSGSLLDYDDRMHIVCCTAISGSVNVTGVGSSENLIIVDGC